MLETLGDNRDLQPNLDEAQNMLTEIDVQKLPSYNWGVKKGLERGIERGLEKSRISERLRVAWQLLDVLDAKTIAEKTGLSIEQVQALKVDKPH